VRELDSTAGIFTPHVTQEIKHVSANSECRGEGFTLEGTVDRSGLFKALFGEKKGEGALP